jgi:hypothetical protein
LVSWWKDSKPNPAIDAKVCEILTKADYKDAGPFIAANQVLNRLPNIASANPQLCGMALDFVENSVEHMDAKTTDKFLRNLFETQLVNVIPKNQPEVVNRLLGIVGLALQRLDVQPDEYVSTLDSPSWKHVTTLMTQADALLMNFPEQGTRLFEVLEKGLGKLEVQHNRYADQTVQTLITNMGNIHVAAAKAEADGKFPLGPQRYLEIIKSAANSRQTAFPVNFEVTPQGAIKLVTGDPDKKKSIDINKKISELEHYMDEPGQLKGMLEEIESGFLGLEENVAKRAIRRLTRFQEDWLEEEPRDKSIDQILSTILEKAKSQIGK